MVDMKCQRSKSVIYSVITSTHCATLLFQSDVLDHNIILSSCKVCIIIGLFLSRSLASIPTPLTVGYFSIYFKLKPN